MAVVLVFATAGEGQVAGQSTSGSAEVAKTQETPAPESLLGESYILTWEKDPRFKGREPFKTVLHPTGGETRRSRSIDLPRTPSEEAAFVIKTRSCVEEALAALEEADFRTAEEKIETAKKMLSVKLVTKTAQDDMVAVGAELVDAARLLSSVRARAALKEALEIAARMQAFFDNDRHGEVVGLYQQMLELDNEKGLRNPEVASTAGVLVERGGELSRRSNIHLDFAQLELKIDAVSHFPQGRSFAIVNGEVIGEGGRVAPELAIASVVSGQKVVFDYKGEEIALGLVE